MWNRFAVAGAVAEKLETLFYKFELTAWLGENTNENKGIGGKGNLWE